MAQPTPTDVHIDAALSNLSIAYKNMGYVADQLFPIVPVDKQSDKYFVWTKDFWFRNYVQERGPGSTYPEGGLELSNVQYVCVNKGLAFPLPWETLDNQDAAIDLETAGADWLAEQFMLDRELALAAALFDASAWTSSTTLSGTSQWNDYATSTPITDVDTGVEAILKLTGVRPNIGFCNEETWNNLKSHPDMLDRFKHTQKGVLAVADVSSVLGIEKLLVGSAIKNTAAEKATFSGNWVWDDNFLLLYSPSSPGLRTPAAGYTFVWRNRGLTIAVKRIKDDLRSRDVLQGDHAFNQKVTGADLGYEIINAIA